MKLDVNLYLGLLGEAFAEALILSRKQGFDASTFVEVINKTPHRNGFSQSKGPKIAAGDFDAAFSLNNLLKDLRLADQQANATGAVLPMSKVALAEYSRAAESGEGDKDFSVIALTLERANGLTRQHAGTEAIVQLPMRRAGSGLIRPRGGWARVPQRVDEPSKPRLRSTHGRHRRCPPDGRAPRKGSSTGSSGGNRFVPPVALPPFSSIRVVSSIGPSSGLSRFAA